MLIIAGTITLAPASIDAAVALIGPFCELVRAEPGCHDYVFTVDPHTPGQLRLFEIWEDDAALQEHFTTPHMAQWREDLAAVGVRDRDLTRYEVASSQPL